MPTYEYECTKCGRTFEVKQRISEAPLTTHEGCGGAVRRLLSPAPFILKGEGWYVTDYPSEARKKAKEAEKAPMADGKAADSKTAESKTGDGKAATDSGTKPSGTSTSASAPATTSPSSSD